MEVPKSQECDDLGRDALDSVQTIVVVPRPRNRHHHQMHNLVVVDL